VLQGIEYYKGKIIAYSLGNFLFGGNTHPYEMDTMIFQTTFGFDKNAKITKQEIQVIPCLVSTTWEINDYCPTILQGTDAQSTIDKVDTRSMEIASNYPGTEAAYSSKAADQTVKISGAQNSGSDAGGAEGQQSTDGEVRQDTAGPGSSSEDEIPSETGGI
jgi:poly-gamma-glutamate synthesis protein (capsule biosynthesis protein)